MKRLFSHPLAILAALFLVGFAPVAVNTLINVNQIGGGSSGNVLTSNGTTATWSSTISAAALPNHSTSLLTSGQLALARGGTNADLSATGGANQFLKQTSSGGAVTVGTIGASDLPTVPVSGGGTGLTALTTGDLWYASATNTASRLGIGSSGQVLSVSGGIPAWSSANTLPAAGTLGRILYDNGSAATYSGAILANQVVYANGSQVPAGSAAFTFDGTRVLRVTSQSNSLSGISQSGMGSTYYPSSSVVLGQFGFVVNGTTGVGTLQALSAENQDATHLGTTLRLFATKKATTAQYTALTLDSEGDVYMPALSSTSATDGFLGLPTAAGKFSGTATRGNGAVGFDTTDGCVQVYNGSAFAGVGTLATIYRNTGTSVSKTCDASDTYIWDDLGGSTGGATYTLPAATCGRRLTFMTLAGDTSGQTTAINRAGSDTIVNATSSGNTSISMTANGSVRVLQADGSSKWIVVSSIGS